MRHPIASSLLFALLCGCLSTSGGADDDDSTGDDDDTSGDDDTAGDDDDSTEAPELTAALEPGDGAEAVDPATPLVCTASRDLVGSSSVSVTDGTGAALSGTGSIVGGALTWTPDAPLPLWAEITAVCEARAADGSATATSTFHTRDGVWSAASRVTESGVEPLAVRLDDGTEVLVWSGASLQSMTRDSEDWTDPVGLDVPEADPFEVRLAGRGQYAAAAWFSGLGDSWQPTVALYDGSWQAAQTVDPSPDSEEIAVAVSASGVATLAWTIRVPAPETTDLWVSQFIGGSWSTPAMIHSRDGRLSFNPEVVAESGSVATVCWQDRGLPSWPINCAQIDGGVAAPPYVFASSEGIALGVALAYEESTDEVTAAWTRGEAPPGVPTVLVSTRSSEGTWAVPTEFVPDDSTTDGGSAALAIGPQGDRIALWRRNGTSSQAAQVRMSQRPAGGTWTTPERVDEGAWTDITTAKVVLDRQGHGMAIWMGRTGSEDRMYASRYRQDSGWSTPEEIVTEGTLSWSASLLVDPSGRATLLFKDNPGPSGVFEARFE